MSEHLIKMKNKLMRNWLVFGILAIAVAGIIFVCLPEVLRRTNLFCQTYQVNSSAENETFIVDKNTVLQQRFMSPYSNIKEIGVHYSNCGTVSDGVLTLELWDETTDQLLAENQKDLLLLKADEYVIFSFPRALELNKEHEYMFVITVDFEKKKAEGAVFVAKTENIQLSDFYIDGELSDKGLDFKITGYNNGCDAKGAFIFILGILVFVMGLMCYRAMNQPVYDSVNWLDWLFVGVALLACMLLFNQGFDMALTIEHSKDLLSAMKHGRFFDFYSIVLDKAMHGGYLGNGVKDAAYYNIILYFIMAIWIAPVYLISRISGVEFSERFYVLYFNILVAALLVYSVYLLYKLAVELGLGRQKAKLSSYIYLSSVIVLFSTVGFCQMDIIYIVIVLMALRKYMQHKYMQFSFLMSLSIMIKVFPILLFVPLILLVEKRLLHIIKYCLAGISFPLVYKIMFGADIGYSYTQQEMGNLYGFFGRAFVNQLSVGIGGCAFFVLIIVVLCIWCFDRNCEETDLWKYIIVVPLIANYSFVIFILWHPEWLIMLMPFSALAIVLLKQKRSLIYCEWGMGVLFCVMTAYYNPYNFDNAMINWGILPMLTKFECNTVTIYEILNKIAYAEVLLTSFLIALMVYFCYNSVRGVIRLERIDEDESQYLSRRLVLIRIATVYLFCLLFAGLYFYVG